MTLYQICIAKRCKNVDLPVYLQKYAKGAFREIATFSAFYFDGPLFLSEMVPFASL